MLPIPFSLFWDLTELSLQIRWISILGMSPELAPQRSQRFACVWDEHIQNLQGCLRNTCFADILCFIFSMNSMWWWASLSCQWCQNSEASLGRAVFVPDHIPKHSVNGAHGWLNVLDSPFSSFLWRSHPRPWHLCKCPLPRVATFDWLISWLIRNFSLIKKVPCLIRARILFLIGVLAKATDGN